MIDVDEAQARLLAAAPRLPAEAVALADAAGRVAAEPIVARRTQPPFPSSAMDGYAIRTADLPGPLRVVGESAAGRRYAAALGPGESVRIFTGAPVPEGADAVLIQEDAAREGDMVRATDVAAKGDNVRRMGLDFALGDTLVEAGTVLAPRHVALAGAGGHAELMVARRPRVAFLATGDELVLPGEPTGPDQIVASITPALAATVQAAGAETIDLGIAPDDRAEIARRARAGLDEADVLVTLGGASVGDHDLVKPALGDLGIEPDFWKVAVRPGKPLMFSSRPLVLGLPGNPVSGAVCAVLFLVPLVRAMQGAARPLPEVHEGVLGRDLSGNGPRRDHMRAVRTGRTITPAARQDSSMLNVLAHSDVLLVREPHAGPASAGETCRYIAL
ncbi:gephyrin-like molybdotransferase Glp [Acuticoccus sp. I52.16.1]|uniref:molybdopterin molybdotransferase MoeA n=1 Tax=Acuticoccus sp. I52.16.1 TaxID=2928472 RepID=UPI001FD5E1C8|nr:gephyrin-like molybdotransferase Glp [Acuticoccus sp. I52.16.1]UOM33264.1 molybdopterin molybdotransferase MoeA [Acuticoccus sp. I52.16.1]